MNRCLGWQRPGQDLAVGPAETPAPVLAKLSEALTKVLHSEVRERILNLGYDPIDDTPADFAAAISGDIARFSAAAASAQAKSARKAE